jgi:hypothetical protein
MFNLFSVAVKQTGVYVHITGVSYGALARDIEKFYSSSLITKWQIRRETWDTIKVHNFFLVEFHLVLGELLKVRNLRSRRRELAELKHLLETETWIKDTVNPIGRQFDFKKLDRFKVAPFPKQREFLEQYPIIKPSYHLKGLLLDAAVGSGKAMPLNTQVKVPGGWKRLGDLKIGDQVIGPKGNVANITGYFPQGVTESFRFTFDDGRTADSHPLHLWEVAEAGFDDQGHAIGQTYVTTTKDIVNHFDQFSYHIPLVGDVGEGLAPSELDLQQIATGLLTAGIHMADPVTELSYVDRRQIAKHMIEQSACHVSEAGVSVVVTNAYGASNFQKVMWSLGGIATQEPFGDGFKVNFKHRDMVWLVDSLVNLSLGDMIDVTQYMKLKLKIVAIQQQPQIETACISIDSGDCLYIVDNWIVTHNTVTSLMWSVLVSDNKCIVLCPLNIVEEVWFGNMRKHFKEMPRVWTSTSGRLLTDDYDYYIVHYEFLQGNHYDYLRKWFNEAMKRNKKQFSLIVDESHNFNDMKSKQTRRLVELADDGLFEDALPMSGTPLKALGSEIYPITCLIDKHFDKHARDFFMASYGRNRPALISLLANRIGRGKFSIPELAGMGDPPPFEIIKVKIPNGEQYTLETIRLAMQTYIVERVRFYNAHMAEFIVFYNDVVQRYEYTVLKHPKELAELQRYKAVVNRFRTQGYNNFTDSADSAFCKHVEESIERGIRGPELAEFRNVKSAVKYLALKIRGEALGNVLGRARINAIKDLIEHAELPKYIDDVEKKTVIFTSYVEALKLSVDYLTKQGYKPVSVFGENSGDRDPTIKQFGEDARTNPLVAVYNSLKEGYPLLMANQIIGLDSPFREHELRQVKGRIWRTGQDAAQCFFRMLDMDTGDKLNITTRSLDILAWSKEQVDALMGRMEGHVAFANVTGEECLDISEELTGRPLKLTNSVLSLF